MIVAFIFLTLHFQAGWAQTCAVPGHFASQNLAIAEISGSTPTHYPDSAPKPQPSTALAWVRIRKPQYRELLQAGTYPNNVDIKSNSSAVFLLALNSKRRRDLQDSKWIATHRNNKELCKPNALIFAKGTMPDFGTAGLGTVGAALSKALQARPGQANNWLVETVNYMNDGYGFSCYGLPGGLLALN
jgi:hypothetical protein